MKRLIPLMMAMLAMACGHDDILTTDVAVEDGGIVFGSERDAVGVEWKNGRQGTRAAGDIPADMPESIGVFAFGNTPSDNCVFRNQKAYYKDSEEYLNNGSPLFEWPYWDDNDTGKQISRWPYTIVEGESVQKPWERMKYRFYAYSPWTGDGSVSVSAENYTGFKHFTWNQVPGFGGSDLTVATEIVERDNSKGKCTTVDSIVRFQMRHIMSRIRFFFKMDENYRKLRKIELDSIEVSKAGNIKSGRFFFDNSLEWDETNHWPSTVPGDADAVIITSAHNLPYEIKTEYDHEEYAQDENGNTLPFNSIYVIPQSGFSELEMTLNYTVYDSEGVATRHASITNTVSLPNWTLRSGHYYDIKINVVPDYLYVLSDNDQDFDGWVIVKDS